MKLKNEKFFHGRSDIGLQIPNIEYRISNEVLNAFAEGKSYTEFGIPNSPFAILKRQFAFRHGEGSAP